LRGIIKTHLDQKQYGFIKGDDGKDYFFCYSSFDDTDKSKICEKLLVDFDPKATPKGYVATKIQVVGEGAVGYTSPDKFLCSVTDKFRDFEILEFSKWMVMGSSRNPNEAKEDMINRAKMIGANALVKVEYFRSTGEETSDSGRGTHYFTIHSCRAIAVNIGKRVVNGSIIDDFICIDKRAAYLKSKLVAKTRRAKLYRLIFWIVILCVSLGLYVSNRVIFAVILIVIAYIFSHATNYDWWLVEI